MGKTGGDTTLRLFRLFPDLIEYADARGDQAKHARFKERPERVAGKARAMNIRRLPSWILAFSIHKSQRGLWPEYKPGPMESPHQMAHSGEPDRHLSSFLEGGAISYWIRQEHLKDDFLRFISHYTDVGDDQRKAVQRLAPVNAATYDRHLEHWFTPAHLELMYENNPQWAAVEREVYSGDATEPAALGQEARMGG
jgi:hypothetical protein